MEMRRGEWKQKKIGLLQIVTRGLMIRFEHFEHLRVKPQEV